MPSRLPDEVFQVWFESIDPEDRYEFLQLSQGTIDQARFVCAYDRALASGEREGRRQPHVQAYSEAFGVSLEEASRRAIEVLNSAPVQGLLQKVLHRDRLGRWIQLENKAYALLEKAIDQAGKDFGKDNKHLDIALKHYEAFGKFIQEEQIAERASRTQRALAFARERMASLKNVTPTSQDAKQFMLALRQQIGGELFYALINELEPEQKALPAK